MDVQATTDVSVRPLVESDLGVADRVLREAFDTFTGATNLFGDRDYVRTRWRADPGHAIAADAGGEFAGSNFVACWGTLGFFGPLSVRPALWDRGIAKALLETTLDMFAAARVAHAGLFTFAHSPKHQGLYQRFGFWPRFLTPLLTHAVSSAAPIDRSWQALSEFDEREREQALMECRQIASGLYDGLDPGPEIGAVTAQHLGDTVIVADDRIAAFAVCHSGAGTEAGSGSCYIKFGAVRSGAGGRAFDRLLDACEAFARRNGARQLEVGVSTACHEAYRHLVERGFRAGIIGVTMHRPNEAGYHRPGAYALSDWR